MDQPEHEVKVFVTEDGAKLRYREWRAKNPKGVVVCIHGVRSHGAWYFDSCDYLCNNGYRVFFPDRRGSGLNKGEGDALPRLQKWVADIKNFIGSVTRGDDNLPIHLLGVSWGGRLASVVAADDTVRLNSLILSAPGLVQRVDLSLYRKVAVVLAFLLGLRRDFLIPLNDAALFTDDPDEQNYIEGDPASLRKASARFLIESHRLERLAKSKFADIRVPMLLLLAGRDRIVDNEQVKKLFVSCRSADKIMRVYPNAAHTLEFDACRQEYFEALVKWLDRHN